MNGDSQPPPPATPAEQPEAGPSRRRVSGASSASPVIGSSRKLRGRQSDLPPPPPTRGGGRKVSKDEMDRIHSSLGPEGISAKREELVHKREAELRTVVDDHDLAVKEKFHLERYVSILEGWNPAEARNDNSSVFMDYKNLHYNLMDLVPAITPTARSSRKSLGPARTTRRQLHAKTEALGIVGAEAAPAAPATPKGKGKARAVEEVEVPEPVAHRRGKAAAEMPPPPVPTKGKRGRRVTIHEMAYEEPEVDEVEEPPTKGKRRGRQSLPAMSKKARLQMEQMETPPPASSQPSSRAPSRSPSPTPAPQLPSLAHLPFPPPPSRPAWRRTGPSRIIYTEPSQIPPPPKHGGDISQILESYIHIDDTGAPTDLAALEQRAAREGYIRNRVNYLQHQGRLMRLLDEEDDSTASKERDRSHQRKAPLGPPPRQTDFQDSLLAHMVQVRNAMMNEAKLKPQVCRKIARMVQLYWEHIENKDERERLAKERELKRRSKEVVKSLKKRWGLAVKIIRAKVVAAQKLEQDRLGKEHLQNMLQRSTGFLEAQREDIVGRGTEEPDDDDASDGTAEVSAAEDSQAEEDEADAEENEGDGEEDDHDSEDAGETDESASDEEAEASDAEAEPNSDLRTLVGMDVDESVEVEATQSASPRQAPASPAIAQAEAPSPLASPEPLIGGTSPAAIHINGSRSEGRPAEEELPAAAHDSLTDETAPETARDDAISSVEDAELAPPSRPTSRRLAKRAKAKAKAFAAAMETPDPDANDIEFAASDSDSDRDDQDAQLDDEMGDAIGVDSEDEGLLADADVPIDELLKRYGYPIQGSEDVVEIQQGASDSAVEVGAESILIEEVASPSSPIVGIKAAPANGNDPSSPSQAVVMVSATQPDQSLTDAALEEAKRDTSPSLLVEGRGKRQRRVRTVWTPEDNPPPPPKKQKTEQFEAPSPEYATESEEEESGEDMDDDDEVEEAPEDSNALRVKPPFLLRGTLRPYQQGGLEWLASLYANNMNGILADEMGLGKTIQTIALLGHLACDRGVWGPHLIIVPTSVILNWEMEFKRFLPGMKVLTYYGNQKERKEKRRGWNTENAWQVCITSYQIVLADQHIFRRKNWVYMILDEAHNIKNFRSQRWQTLLGFKTQRRLLLTGTPLQNNLMELWSLLYFLMPNGITADATAVVGFANHKEFMEWFSNPMDKAVESGETMDEDMIETVTKLHTLLRPFILRRLKSEVETQLPGKFEHVVYCRLSKRQRFLYDEFMSRASTREALTSGGYLGVVNILMQLRKVCNHPDLFEVRPVRTSFAMEQGVLSEYEPTDLLVRKRLLDKRDELDLNGFNLLVTSHEGEAGWVAAMRSRLDASDKLPYAIEPAKKGRAPAPPKADTRTVEGWLKYREHLAHTASVARWHALRDVNRRRCQSGPIYGSTTLAMLSDLPQRLMPEQFLRRKDLYDTFAPPAVSFVRSLPERLSQITPVIDRFAIIPPTAVARDVPRYALPGVDPLHPTLRDPEFDSLHVPTVKLQIAFPDTSLLQYDCGKLQKLAEMLRDLKADGHRVLIFTQMTRVLDILEIFLSYNGHRYLRLDGSTKIEDRQIITERFNSDARIFCFIASSRSGGVGINLTGADTVFFYDSDWNPSMDRQCMDRAHRIGQTRTVNVYRFVSMHTVEENMLKKANQKRLLDRVVIQDGDFTTEFFGRMDWRDMLDDDIRKARAEDEDADRIEDIAVEDEPEAEDATAAAPRIGQERELAAALAEVEDEEDAAAARMAQGEAEMDFDEFAEGRAAREKEREEKEAKEAEAAPSKPERSRTGTDMPLTTGSNTPMPDEEEEYDEDDVGGIDEYMLRFVEEEWEYFSNL